MTNPSIRKPASRHSHEPASRHSHESGNLVLSVRKLIGYSGLTKIRTRRRSRRQYK
ncbi:hypothetical protein [Neisseria meningitidis]|uniref:hypothetical protein n=1 Tax=Neisseria meningitidis TaxID=487 RepID=UPI00164C6F43|nr:hypothetical protein [Neisseria meningitidis]